MAQSRGHSEGRAPRLFPKSEFYTQNIFLLEIKYAILSILEYLLASEGGVCEKFNLSNCCLWVDDKGKAIDEITDRTTKVASCPSPHLERLEPWEVIQRMVFNSWGTQSPHGNYPLDFGSLLNPTLPSSPGYIVGLQPH